MALNKINIDFSGQDINLIVQQFFIETTFVDKFGARVERGVKSKYVYHDLTDDINLEAYEACPSEASGNATLTQKSGKLCRFMMTAKMENQVLLDTYLQSQYGAGTQGDKIANTEIGRMIVDRFIDKGKTQWDDIVLNGSKAYGSGFLDLCDGLLTQWDADATVNDVTGTTVTESNVLDELDKVINAVPKRLRFTTDARRRIKIGAAINICNAYEATLVRNAAGYQGYNPTDQGLMRYRGIDIVPLENLEDDIMFATPPENIVLVVDDAQDFAKFNITDKSQADALCDVTTMKMAARGSVFYGIGDNVVFYA